MVLLMAFAFFALLLDHTEVATAAAIVPVRDTLAVLAQAVGNRRER